MGAEVIILPAILGVIFGIYYVYISARNKERMALIDKGADASIFFNSKDRKVTPIWKIIILNLSLLCMGIGIGIFIAGILDKAIGVDEDIAYPGTIFLMAGIGLYTSFTITKNLDK
ncbi:DUF6249 domain-containing protein [Aquimarina hainanensis]|uniref:DUF6249 domain-containing protein n=1 Tax=Aquimarina hainanensis TaxID=1578017 RepID=A0ABW5N580_9FLAO|nr:DUF6249 domain-containing protein [Aquimarina sp. TRL1]QKX05930.1 hypothetical protein HN014_13780 [Aquimarina sp. TRL1]